VSTLADLECALERDDLADAVRLAVEHARKHGQPIPLEAASRFLPLVLRESPTEYDAYALRFLARWAAERGRSIDQAVDVAVALAELPEADGQAAALGAGRLLRFSSA
jgi:hypothetical protein